MTIALLVPTRARPEQCQRMIDSANATANGNVHVMLAIQEDQIEAYKDVKFCSKMIVPDWPTVQSWNELAKAAMLTKAKLFMLCADDVVFSTPLWADALLNHHRGLKEKCHVYSLQDSRDEAGTPHPIVSREWVDAMGYAFPPIFLHWKLDVWTVAIAKANGVFTHFKDFMLTHIKPSDAGVCDETHLRIRRAGWRERDQYVAQTCDHFLKQEMVRLDNVLRKREAA